MRINTAFHEEEPWWGPWGEGENANTYTTYGLSTN
jgi:hypothetical protein